MVKMFPTQGEILMALSKGAVIIAEYTGGPVYRLSSDGRPIRQEMFDTLLANRLIKPNQDSLFGPSQTFSFRRSTDMVPDDAE